MNSYLMLGFLIGMTHAFETDHLAAVGTLVTSGKNSPRRMAALGAAWGLGHTTTLFVLAVFVITFGFVLSELMTNTLEFFVGCMLIALGLHALWKLKKSGIHFHRHTHGTGPQHIHAHHHETKEAHSKDAHDHEHVSRFSLKSYAIGLVHGVAGTAGLLVLVTASTQDPMMALLYVLLFGLGSVFGMAFLTFVISWPIQFGARFTKNLMGGLQVVTGCLAIVVGIKITVDTGSLILGSLTTVL
ncbi:hypothetical protein [Pseudovibrio sp. Tun.PSC04-5.I4]|uniref:HoxN/HupN/NixA family nickel/cobalt transporter n=1 Tax=Pseudovibrio sp. Tun.PSC04-5.I4 TaxID=1798213 RepID=UPI00088931BA|nr:hypothetical protein [Pseudovibrio sp. Tun.PSC04-5.I4]SDQ12038.1 High-affinity nickel-transport protein [Pseudovibrio sp. Tun.PSC04-5.I4]